MLQCNIIKFLESRGWLKIIENQQFTELKAPEELGFLEEYTLRIPVYSNDSEHDRYTGILMDIISDLYEIKRDDLEVILREEQSIFSVHLSDEETQEGTIPLIKFQEMITQIKDILLKTASFAISQVYRIRNIPGEAYKYVNLCRFLQTQRGSFITKIQLPSECIIKPKDLFSEELRSKDITYKLSNVLTFINKEIFSKENIRFDEKFFQENHENINLDILEDINKLYEEVKNVDFKFIGIDQSTEINTREVSGVKKKNLSELIEFVIESTEKEIEKETIITGKIIALKSKNPDGSKNDIRLSGLLDNKPVEFEANLTSSDYKKAIDAHKRKKDVKMKGLIKEKKNICKFLRVDEFSVKD
ncbi:MAG: hypothetical protein ACM3SY_21910 [Candidatus Omnitrophota bacterium]